MEFYTDWADELNNTLVFDVLEPRPNCRLKNGDDRTESSVLNTNKESFGTELGFFFVGISVFEGEGRMEMAFWGFSNTEQSSFLSIVWLVSLIPAIALVECAPIEARV